MTAEQTEGPADEVLFGRRGHLGVITLNRPKAVNALTAGMVAAMTERLAASSPMSGAGNKFNPNLIFPGQSLYVPPGGKEPVRHDW